MLFSPKPLILIIGMTTRRKATRKVKEWIATTKVPSQGNQAPPLEQVPMGYKVPIVPPPMIDGQIRSVFLNLSQDMTSQDDSSEVHSMKA